MEVELQAVNERPLSPFDINAMEIDCESQWDSLNERPGTPLHLIEASERASENILPEKSKGRYEKAYKNFQKWKQTNCASSNSERVLLAFFGFLNTKYKPTSLWAAYSMIKAVMKIRDKVDISKYYQVTAFLKAQSVDYQPTKAKILFEEELRRFINESSDDLWLDVKVVAIFALFGACRTHELPDVLLNHVTRHDDILLVSVPNTKTKVPNKQFAVTDPYVPIVEKYAALRPEHVTHNRFFLNYQKGKCTVQPMGKNKFYKMPERIATFLKLDEPTRYTGHSFRRSSASLLANTGASTEMVKRHGCWKSTKVAESYIESSIHYKKQTGERIGSTLNKSPIASVSSVVDKPIASVSSLVDEPLASVSSVVDKPIASVSTVVDKNDLMDSIENMHDGQSKNTLDLQEKDETAANILTQNLRENIQQCFKL